ncbi:Hypothetical predicted protein [Prunus dulcis]|uniref:Uncharacterized protein n=2 Tax=Prunus dulcis TaxID=3755 RepID=A0A5E4FNL5_PRUDU|nr:Hypothetical predicted protein [Prunus dulcis]
MSKSLKKEVCESKKRANELVLKDMEERLTEDTANLWELVELKPWKVKLLIHDSANSHVKKGIRETATKAGVTVEVVKDAVMMEH